jgi:hypothetical protein
MTRVARNCNFGFGLFHVLFGLLVMTFNKDYASGVICLAIAWFCLYGFYVAKNVTYTKLYYFSQAILGITVVVNTLNKLP